MAVDVGDAAPQFTLQAPDGAVTLEGLLAAAPAGVIVYFYPAAMTPGCTTQACDFRDSMNSLQARGWNVVGISPDPVEKLARFAERDALNFPLAADPDHSVAAAYGAWGEKRNYGRTYDGLIRSTFVVAPDGRITHAMRNVRATGHVARLRKELGVDLIA